MLCTVIKYTDLKIHMKIVHVPKRNTTNMTFKVKNLICYCVFTSLSSIFEKKIINNTKQGLLRPKKTQHQANTKILYLQE